MSLHFNKGLAGAAADDVAAAKNTAMNPAVLTPSGPTLTIASRQPATNRQGTHLHSNVSFRTFDPEEENSMPTKPFVRRASRLILALAVTLNAVIAVPAFAANKVTMGWLPATDALPFFVALEEKSFEKAGIEVVNQRFDSPTALVDALISNQIDVGPYGTAPGIALVAEAQNPGSLKLFGLSGASPIPNMSIVHSW